jgi:hypothetical protein
MTEYHLVTVRKYHGFTHPEEVTLKRLTAPNLIEARRIAIGHTISSFDNFYNSCKANYELYNCDVDDDLYLLLSKSSNSEQFIEKLIECPVFDTLNWGIVDCGCEGCFVSLHLFEEADNLN